MENITDGNYTREQTQSAVNLIEATFYKLVSLEADKTTVENVATFESTIDIVQTLLVELPSDMKCAGKGAPPAGSWVCCSDEVYVSGQKKPVAGYR